MLVGEATRRATEQTVAYEDAGSHELKGKVGLTQLWRALRVVSGARGTLKSAGLEAPFVGRDRELRQIKDLFHACADEGKAHLVSITGIAGIGKSRLGWEFYKYFDGIVQTTYWHRGRCLAYGEGVTYWALADMVRMRARIAEDEEPGSALTKLAAVVEEHIDDAEERRFVEPRLAHLLAPRRERRGTSGRISSPRGGCSSSGWPVVYPVVMVFEDMQWADASLLDFIEYLLEWAPQLADPRRHAGAAGAPGAPAHLGRRPSQFQLDLPRAALSRGDGGAARRPRSRPACGAAGADPRAGGGRSRCTRSRRCGCCSTGARSSRTGRSTARPARSSRSRCPRRCTP